MVRLAECIKRDRVKIYRPGKFRSKRENIRDFRLLTFQQINLFTFFSRSFWSEKGIQAFQHILTSIAHSLCTFSHFLLSMTKDSSEWPLFLPLNIHTHTHILYFEFFAQQLFEDALCLIQVRTPFLLILLTENVLMPLCTCVCMHLSSFFLDYLFVFDYSFEVYKWNEHFQENKKEQKAWKSANGDSIQRRKW